MPLLLLEISGAGETWVWILGVVALLFIIFSAISNSQLSKQVEQYQRGDLDSFKILKDELKQQIKDAEANHKFILMYEKSSYQAKLKDNQNAYQKTLHEKIMEFQKNETKNKADLHQYYKEWADRELDKYKKNELEKYATVLLQQWKEENEIWIRQDAIKRSGSVNFGKITEHLFPFYSSFPFNHKDVRFIGSPIDLIVFDGHDEQREDITVYIIEVKTGNSKLSMRQQNIKRAIENKKVKWLEVNPDVVINSGQELPFEKKKEEPYNFHRDLFDKPKG